jgi:dipeptidyl aminopeptidase/acylaminoacyl peptidase
MRKSILRRSVVGALAALVAFGALAPERMAAQTQERVREPLPLDIVVSLRGHNGRSPINLSPDGEWIAHTVQTDENVPRDSVSFAYSATGFSFAEGDARMEATITNTRTGETIRLGGEASASWAAVWSPDGTRVAFYSDEGGEAGIWVWEMETRTARRLPGVIARPYFGFEGVRWSSVGERIIAKVLPAGTTLAEANAREGERRMSSGVFPPVEPGQPSVIVRRHDPSEQARDSAAPGTSATRDANTGWAAVDLVIIDVRTDQVTRAVERTPVRVFALSPDERSIAYTIMKGSEANTQQPIFDLVVVELASGGSRTIATDIRLGYGIEWSWAPDSRSIAYISSGQLGDGEIVIVSATDGSERWLRGDGVPSFDPGEGEHPPLWSADGMHLFAVGDGALWRVDARSGQGTAVGSIPDWQIRAIVTPFGSPTIWSSDSGRTVWVTAAERGAAQSGIYAVDLLSGQARAALREPRSYSGIFNVTASDATREIAFVSTDLQHLPDVWVFETRTGRVRQVTRLNTALDRYELGTVRVIEWRGPDGDPLRGALLLPPGYREGQKLPLVVSVYGGTMGSAVANTFGGWGGRSATFNAHVLTTRGYAVLYPDAPLREGRTMTDLPNVVLPGVNAAIDAGHADPERLAVMGQSYGSFNTLALITQTTRFKAAVITAAVLHPDLFADYLGSIGYYERGQGKMGGSIWEHRDRYFDNSPLFLFDRIETPLLIGQGERDGDLTPSNVIFSALERLGKPVEFRLYQAEGHVLTQKPNVLDFWQRRLDFFREHLDLALDARGAILFENGRAKSRR